MSKTYPETIELMRYTHIPDATIIKDIADTEAEIGGLEKQLEAERHIADHSPNEMERRMADFKAGARPGQIAERQNFIAFLTRLQEARRAASN